MEQRRIPKPGEIYTHFKDKPYQIITVATHTETRERMVVYQALYGDFKTYVRPLETFLSEVDRDKYPNIRQKYRFEMLSSHEEEQFVLQTKSGSMDEENIPVIEKVDQQIMTQSEEDILLDHQKDVGIKVTDNELIKGEQQHSAEATIQESKEDIAEDGIVNSLLLKFLDAESYNRKLEVLTSNIKHMNDRLINDMAVSLDCTVEEGPLDERIQGLIYCLQAMCRFEDRRLR